MTTQSCSKRGKIGGCQITSLAPSAGKIAEASHNRIKKKLTSIGVDLDESLL